MSIGDDPDWKLKLRYGQLTTPFSHFAMVADGALLPEDSDEVSEGKAAVMSVKVWATDTDQAADVFISVANQTGFKIADRLEIYETEPDRAPADNPYAYELNFTPYEEESE